jgi:hypothetical protein
MLGAKMKIQQHESTDFEPVTIPLTTSFLENGASMIREFAKPIFNPYWTYHPL